MNWKLSTFSAYPWNVLTVGCLRVEGGTGAADYQPAAVAVVVVVSVSVKAFLRRLFLTAGRCLQNTFGLICMAAEKEWRNSSLFGRFERSAGGSEVVVRSAGAFMYRWKKSDSLGSPSFLWSMRLLMSVWIKSNKKTIIINFAAFKGSWKNSDAYFFLNCHLFLRRIMSIWLKKDVKCQSNAFPPVG